MFIKSDRSNSNPPSVSSACDKIGSRVQGQLYSSGHSDLDQENVSTLDILYRNIYIEYNILKLYAIM